MKKMLSVVVATALAGLLVVGGFATPAQATDYGDLGNPTPLTWGASYPGTLSNTNTSDVFRLDLPSAGQVDISFNSTAEWAQVGVYDEAKAAVTDDQANWDSTLRWSTYSRKIYLDKGTHYLAIGKYAWRSDATYTGPYTLSAAFSSSNETFVDGQGGSDNTTQTAHAISFGTPYRGQLSEIKWSNRASSRYTSGSAVDFFTFTTGSKADLQLDFSLAVVCGTSARYAELGLGAVGGFSWSSYARPTDGPSRVIKDLPAGTYYFSVRNSGYPECGGTYAFAFGQLRTAQFNANGGSGTMTKQYTAGSALGALPTATRTGHSLLGWFTAASGGAPINASTTLSLDATFYAHWIRNTYTVRFNVNGGKKLAAGKASKKVIYATRYSTLPKPKAKKGKKFVGWYTSKRGGSKVTASSKVSITKTTTFYAHWKKA